MKPLSVFLSFLLFFVIAQVCMAEIIIVGPVKGADVSATIDFQSDLSAAIKNRSDNLTASTINFGTVPSSTGGKIAQQYIEVSYACNYGSQPPNPVWGNGGRCA